MARPSTQRFWIVLLAITAVVGSVGWWADREVRGALQHKLRTELETVLGANATALEIWMQAQERLAAGIAEDPQVRRAALEILQTQGLETMEGRELARLPAQSLLDQALGARLKTAGYMVANLVSTQLQTVADSGPGRLRIGATVIEEHRVHLTELFQTGEPVVITPFQMRFGDRRRGDGAPGRPGFGFPGGGTNRWGRSSGTGVVESMGPPVNRGMGPSTNRAWGGGPSGRAGGWRQGGGPPRSGMMQVAAPVRDDSGTVVGALALILNPELEFSKMLSVVRQGETGETYVFDDGGRMLSQSRFDPQLKKLGLLEDRNEAISALTLELRDPGGDLSTGYQPTMSRTNQPLTTMVAQAVAGGSGVQVEPTRDYRGIPVVGAWRWLPERRIGIVTQMDAMEAYQPLKVLRSIFLILLGLVAIFAVGVLGVYYSNLLWRRKAKEAELQLRTLGQYTLEEKIGEGGMGVVYKARHALLRRETAVKLLLPGRADDASVRQFEREVQLTCELTHPNTIQVYDFGRTPDGIFYYAMEFLRGLNLADLVAAYGPQPEARILHVLRQVCGSLQEAHQAGLVHRDIKPANIILCDRGGMPDTVKVLDFGLVRQMGAGVDGPKAKGGDGPERLSGTPNYLAPEAIRNPGHSDPRGDLYALGAVAYFLATGLPVFEGESYSEVLEHHLRTAPVAIRERCPGNPVSAEFESLVLRCLAKDPAQRPSTAAELRQWVESCPLASAWDLDRSRTWWLAHERRSPAADSRIPDPAGSTPTVEATLRIDLAQRPG
ncbi:MAG: serine/threonine protein kinase [Verrucomicrobiales bacterium]|nr:serine/threonine protein kinase [Verrucomicrobiales bacterium]